MNPRNFVPAAKAAPVDPLHAEAMAAQRAADFEAAEQRYRQLAQKHPQNRQFKVAYVHMLAAQYKYPQAIQALTGLIKKDRGAKEFLHLRGIFAMNAGDFRRAEQDLQRLCKENAAVARYRMHLGTLYKTFGYLEKAKDAYAEALSLDPRLGESYRLLRDVDRAREVSELDRRVADDVRAGTRTGADFHFGLGKLHDDLGEPDLAWEYFREGNRLRREATPAAAAGEAAAIARRCRERIVCLAEGLGATAREAAAGAVFVSGFPRSGTTLIENVLASDDHFEACGELPFCGNAETGLIARKGVSEPLDSSDIDFFGDYYAGGRRNLKTGRRLAIDKSTVSFRVLGLALLAFHDLKVVQLVRDPLDNVLSVYRSCFTQGNAYSFDLDEIIAYLAVYYESARCWKALFPDRIAMLSYDAYVRDPEAHNRSLADWLGGDYAFRLSHSNQRVLTATASQLGDAVRTDSSGNAQAYAEQMKPWEAQIEALRDAARRCML